jgi:lysozyme family protein
MKTILTILLLFVAVETSYEQNLSFININFEPKVSFKTAYNHVRKWEGNYAYLPYDKGGETYGGIARNYNKNWDGWSLLDRHKKDSTVFWNKKIPELEKWVVDYYYNVWINDGYYLLKDQLIANYIFDYRNTGNVAYKHVQLVLQQHGYPIKITGKMNTETINALNNINSLIFILHLQELRKEFYLKVVNRKPEMNIYLRGWLNRTNDIPV